MIPSILDRKYTTEAHFIRSSTKFDMPYIHTQTQQQARTEANTAKQ